MKKILRYKFLRKGLKSENGNLKWSIGEWKKLNGELEMCRQGFHACKDPYDAFSYVHGEICAVVECKGKHLKDENKECWSEQRVIKTYKWTKKGSLKLAIYSAELVLPIYEKKYEGDLRPRKAIEAAKKVLWRDTPKNRAAAYAADAAAHAVDAAAHAVDAAARKLIIKKIQKYFLKLVKELKPL